MARLLPVAGTGGRSEAAGPGKRQLQPGAACLWHAMSKMVHDGARNPSVCISPDLVVACRFYSAENVPRAGGNHQGSADHEATGAPERAATLLLVCAPAQPLDGHAIRIRRLCIEHNEICIPGGAWRLGRVGRMGCFFELLNCEQRRLALCGQVTLAR